MDMKIVKQRVIADIWPVGKNKVGDAYRSLSKQVEGIIRSLSNAQTDAAWLPLDWMGIDEVVELVHHIYNRPSDRMLLDRLSRKRKHPDYLTFRMLDKEKAAQKDTELTYEADDIMWKNRGYSEGKLRNIERVKILDGITIIDEIIRSCYRGRDYKRMIIEIMNVNEVIYKELIEEYGLYGMMGLRVNYPGYIDQYLELIHRTTYRLVIEYILTERSREETKSKIERYTMAVSQIISKVENLIEDYKQNTRCEKAVKDIMIRFTQYLYAEDYYEKIMEIMQQLEYMPAYIENIDSQKTLTKRNQKRLEIQSLLRLASISGNYIASNPDANEDVLLSEIFLDRAVYDRKTARTIVHNLLDSPVNETALDNLLNLRFLDMKYLRGCVYIAGGESSYLAVCNLRKMLGELLLLPYSIFDDRLLYKVMYNIFRDLLGGIRIYLLSE